MGTGEADDVVSGRSRDRQRAVLMSATGQLPGRLREFSRDRRHSRRRQVASEPPTAALGFAGSAFVFEISSNDDIVDNRFWSFGEEYILNVKFVFD